MDIADGWRADWWNEAERLGVAGELRRLNAIVDAAMQAKVKPARPPTDAERYELSNRMAVLNGAFKENYP